MINLRKLLTVLTMIILPLLQIGNISEAFDPYNYTFSKNQSHELSELIDIFIEASPESGSIITWNTGEYNTFIYWDVVEHSGNGSSYPSYKQGAAGILFNGKASMRTSQKWQDGQLIKKNIESGFPCGVTIRGKLYWAPSNVKISIPMSPIIIKKHLNQTGEFSLGDYLSEAGMTVEQLWKKGYSGYGETGWKVKTNKGRAWILCDTSHGVNGLVGNIEILIFYSLEDAKTNSMITK